jgi:hypothetical protein
MSLEFTVHTGQPDHEDLAALTAVLAAVLARSRARPVDPPARLPVARRFPTYETPLSWRHTSPAW